MREIDIKGRKIPVRSLRRKEIKAFNDDGIDFMRLTQDKIVYAVDTALGFFLDDDTCDYSKEDDAFLDELETSVYLGDIYIGILKETVGAKDEEKNLLNGTSGEQTEKELSTANDVKS